MTSTSRDRPLARRVANQGALLTAGHALSQAFSFFRNALIGHALSAGDFGIAASLTMMLQMVDILTDFGADRLIVQAPDGDDPRLLANAHTALVARGMLTATLLWLAAGPISSFFAIPHAKSSFEILALAPLIKGFMHLDWRRAQRRLDNWPSLEIELVQQGQGLLFTLPVIWVAGDYSAVVWLAILQALVTVLVSHVVAVTPYALRADLQDLKRIVSFGWPILVASLPIIAVYQGDRIIVGRLMGMETLAGYSAAFMLTMVPCLLAVKVGQSLMLPLFAQVLTSERQQIDVFRNRYVLLSEAVALAASLYLVMFVIAGGKVLPIAFGAHYQGLDTLTAWLALMWALRLVQTVPCTALLAIGLTRPLLVGGLVRGSALALALAVALSGFGIEMVAASGAAGELAAMLYLTHRLSREIPGLARGLLARTAIMAAFGLVAVGIAQSLGDASLAKTLAAGALLVAVMLGLALANMRGVRTLIAARRAQSGA